MPSLKQLNEAVHGVHRRAPRRARSPSSSTRRSVTASTRSEVAEFDDAVANNELVAPPAGAIGRGDAFVLSIANKVEATILSNDSFQEFHGDLPVAVRRGPADRRQARAAHRLGVRRPQSGAWPDQPQAVRARRRRRQEATRPTVGAKVRSRAPPPGAVDAPSRAPEAAAADAGAEGAAAGGEAATPADGRAAVRRSRRRNRGDVVNDFTSFLSFVEHHPVGTSVNAIVETYSSHGAYVKIGDVVGLRAAAADGRPAAAQRPRGHEDRRRGDARRRELRAGPAQHRPRRARHGLRSSLRQDGEAVAPKAAGAG